jgi:type IV pilus assembly protein PilB
MAYCPEKRLIGEVLIERGLITSAQLEKALGVQKKEGASVFIGEVLVQLGYLSEVDIAIALVVQCNLPYIAVNKHHVEPDVLRLIPAEVARRSRLVPLDRIGNILSVVMSNPMNELVREEVESLTGCRIAVFISTQTEIDAAIERLYGRSS